MFFRYIKPYWKSVFISSFLMLIQVGMDLLQPGFMAKIVDEGIKTGDMELILKTGLMMTGAAFAGLLSGLGSTTASSYTSMCFGADLRTNLFNKIQYFSFSQLDRFKTSSLITRLTNDVTQIQNVVLMSMRVLIRAPLLCIGGLIMAVKTNLHLAVIFLFAIPVLSLTILITINKGFPLFTMVQKKLDRVNSVIRENLSGVRVIKAFARHNWEKKRFETANNELKDVTVKATRIMIIIMPLMMLIMNLSVVAVIFFGGILAKNNNILIGQIMAFVNYMTLILFSLLMMAYVLIIFSRAKASAERINEVLKAEISLNNESEKNEIVKNGSIRFENITFSYSSNSEPVLKNISFNIQSGQTIAIIGGTGSGKSTLVGLMLRLYEIENGKIYIGGKNIKSINIKDLRDNISLVPQESILFSGTIKDNILWGNKDASQKEVEESAKTAQAHDFITKFKEGYDKILSQRAVNLSGGQKQRISIARALIKKPKILILDDSTSAVDSQTEYMIQKGIKNYIKGITCIIIAQKISSVVEADKILVMDKGKIAGIGTHEELLESSSIYKEIYKSQFGKVEI